TDDNRLSLDASHAEHGALWVVDDRREGIDAEGAKVRDGEGPTLHLFRLEPALPGALDQIARPLGHLAQAKIRRIANDGNEQTGFGIHSDADMTGARDHDFFAGPASIEQRMLAQCDGRQLHKEIAVAGNDLISGASDRLELV